MRTPLADALIFIRHHQDGEIAEKLRNSGLQYNMNYGVSSLLLSNYAKTHGRDQVLHIKQVVIASILKLIFLILHLQKIQLLEYLVSLKAMLEEEWLLHLLLIKIVAIKLYKKQKRLLEILQITRSLNS